MTDKTHLDDIVQEEQNSRKIIDKISFQKPYSDGCTVESSLTAKWNPEKNIWEESGYERFLEGYERGEQVFIEHNDGPYKAGTSARKEILKAYFIPEEDLKLDDVINTSPEELAKISNEVQGHFYSIRYDVEGDDGESTIDWDATQEKWKRTWRDRGGSCHPWEDLKGIDDYAYNALLNAFGLDKTEYPLEKISTMSPRKLARTGEYDSVHSTMVGEYDPVSSTLNDHRKASQVR